MDDATPNTDEDLIVESLIHWSNDSQLIKDLEITLIEITTFEGIKPHGIFQDTYSEEMNFPTLFFGHLHPTDISNKLSYQKIAKWELMH